MSSEKTLVEHYRMGLMWYSAIELWEDAPKLDRSTFCKWRLQKDDSLDFGHFSCTHATTTKLIKLDLQEIFFP